MLLSHDPEIIREPSGENATDKTGSLCPRRVVIAVPVFASQSRTVQSCDPEAIRVPSGENATALTSLPYPRKVGRISAPEPTSQTRMVWSTEPETMRVPSGENPTDKTDSSFPRSVVDALILWTVLRRTSVPEVKSHTRIVWFRSDPETIRVPSGENATDWNPSSCPCTWTTSAPVVAFHTPILSNEEETTKFPSGENATEVIHLSLPRRVGRISAPEFASQIRSVLSLEPETIRVPSGENATAQTAPSCPRSAGMTSAPESASQMRIV